MKAIKTVTQIYLFSSLSAFWDVTYSDLPQIERDMNALDLENLEIRVAGAFTEAIKRRSQ
ncbi:MAG: hypothetical protein LBP89_00245 [Helicobacteraceae bacterium]|jgi:hypothetical protein|nr:hypothetical protein [Helicobacteraceae bacterium]